MTIAAVLGGAVASPAPAGAASADSRLHVGSPTAIPSGAADSGPVSPSLPLHLEVALVPRDPAGLAALARGVSDPRSPLYHRYLSRGAFAARFGAAPSTITAVETALRQQGLTPTGVSANRLLISVDDPLGTVSRGMRTAFRRYRLPSGRMIFANSTTPMLPADVAGSVVGVSGLSDLARWHPEVGFAAGAGQEASGATAAPAPGALVPHVAGPQPCSSAQSTSGLTSNLLASAYNINNFYGAGDLGSGQTVALFELAAYGAAQVSDVSTFASCYGITPNVNTIAVDGGNSSTSGTVEDVLDVEDVLGLAPSATVDVYLGPNTDSGVLDTYQRIASDDTASVISTSWGVCEPGLTGSDASTENTIFEQAAAQGQTVLAAAGDAGSSDCWSQDPSFTTLEVDDPGSQPYVTSVGGTTLHLTPGGAWQSESVWRVLDNGGSGGGISTLWQMPAWQSGAAGFLGVVNSGSSTAPCGSSTVDCREVPDVTADADPATGLGIYYTGSDTGHSGWQPIGGTSMAAPLWGSLVALANGSADCSGPVGYLNPAIYGLASMSSAVYGSVLHDITSGDNNLFSSSGSYRAKTGYDMASGLGSPVALDSAGGLVAGLCGAPLVAAISPSSGTDSGGTSVTLTGANLSGATVTIGGSAVSPPASCSATSCTFITPTGSGAEPVVATVGSLSATTSFLFTSASGGGGGGGGGGGSGGGGGGGGGSSTPTPSITVLSPTSGPASGGNTVSIEGSGLSGGVVTVGTTFVTANCTDTLCTFTAPAGSGTVNVIVSTGGGSASAPYTYVAPQPATVGPDGKGYWLVGSDGGIFAFGDAAFFGSTGAMALSKPVVGMAPTPDGKGYWLVGSDGGIFAFGDAPFFGSTGAMALSKPIVGMAPTPDGKGCWLVGSDGGIFAFGDAGFFGSTGAMALSKPVVGLGVG